MGADPFLLSTVSSLLLPFLLFLLLVEFLRLELIRQTRQLVANDRNLRRQRKENDSDNESGSGQWG